MLHAGSKSDGSRRPDATLRGPLGPAALLWKRPKTAARSAEDGCPLRAGVPPSGDPGPLGPLPILGARE
eukprot:5863957-Alexandrium_andersonii.AAC.1